MSMTNTPVKQAIFRHLGVIAPEADLNTLNPDENVREALDIDSYDFLSFLIGLGEELGIEVPEGDYAKLTTLHGMTDYLTERVARGPR